MKPYIYQGGRRIVRKSGVGKAIEHQRQMLENAGAQMAQTWKEADVIHINTVFPDSYLAAMLAKLQGKKVVYYGHSTKEDFKNSFIGSNLFAKAFRAWIKCCYQKGDVIVTPTEYSKSILQGYGIRKPIVALTNGVDTEFFQYEKEAGIRFREKYGYTEDQRIVISAGHLIRRKGILDFLETARRMPDVRFIWFGETKSALLTDEVREAVREKPENVTFAGFVPAEELRDAYSGADAFAFFSYEETEGIVVLEALACEIPVIVRDIPVYGTWLTNGKEVYKADGTDAYVEKLNYIFHNAPESVMMEGRKLAKRHDIKRTGARLMEIYAEMERQTNGGAVAARVPAYKQTIL